MLQTLSEWSAAGHVPEHIPIFVLADPSLTLGEIVLLLGYSGHSAFSRAFRHWTGRIPAQVRRERV